MKKLFCMLGFLFLSLSTNAALITVDFTIMGDPYAGNTVATGSFSYDSGLDGGLIGYSDLSSFQINLPGPYGLASPYVYNLSDVNALSLGNTTYFNFDTAIDEFIISNALSDYQVHVIFSAGNLAPGNFTGFWISSSLYSGDTSSPLNGYVNSYNPKEVYQYWADISVTSDRNSQSTSGSLNNQPGNGGGSSSSTTDIPVPAPFTLITLGLATIGLTRKRKAA